MNGGPWLVLGPGALGRLLATRLAGHVPLALIGRQTSDRPLSLTTPKGETSLYCVSRITVAQAPLRPALVHLTTKTHAAEAALDALAAHIPQATPLVLWQNGYQVQEPLTRCWAGPVLCATTSEGAYTVGEDGVVHAGQGHTFIGHLDGGHDALAGSIARTLTRVGLRAEPCSDIRMRLWHKLAVNAAINPLVARFRIRNGQLRDRPFRPMVDAIVAEVALIMTAEGIAPPENGWAARVWQVIDGTANNRASMLQDVLAGRPTEHDAILGPLLDAAIHHRLDVPALTTLWKQTP